MKVFISGPMGVGKTAVGRALAARRGVPFFDLDEQIEKQTGQTVRSIFEREGETGFRLHERTAFDALFAQDAFVCALGGGAVTQHEVRRRAQFEGRLVSLRARPDTIEARLTQDEVQKRPLLAGGDGGARLRAIMASRAGVYAEAHETIEVDGLQVNDVAARIESELAMDKVLVPLGERSYCVEIGRGVRPRAQVAARGASSLFVVSDTNVSRLWQQSLGQALGTDDYRLAVFEAGEAQKNLDVVSALWDQALEAGVDRKGLVVALGGGVVGDMAGFVAATLFRGVRALQMPTSLLAMVDSSVGGKTGFDHRLGKNLIGAFFQPTKVVCDLDFLSTLPKVELISGLAEVVKSAWLAGEEAVSVLEKDADALAAGDLDALGRAVTMSVQLKARIVADDEHEGGARKLLNLGHTVGHALEAAGGYQALRHGEAVALGMVIAFAFSVSRGLCRNDQQARVTTLMKRLGLPTTVHSTRDARPFLHQDKKRTGKDVAFVFPKLPGQTVVHAVPLAELEAFLCNNFP